METASYMCMFIPLFEYITIIAKKGRLWFGREEVSHTGGEEGGKDTRSDIVIFSSDYKKKCQYSKGI